MVDILDKNIHGDEFRLRILVTNRCNKDVYGTRCDFCLNDFQCFDKTEFINPYVFDKVLTDYCNFISKGNRIVTISGGEPGLHQNLINFIRQCKWNSCRTILVTNGHAIRSDDDLVDIMQLVDSLHLSVYSDKDIRKLSRLSYWRKKVVVQSINTNKDDNLELLFNIANECCTYRYRMKLFDNFLDQDINRYINVIELIRSKFPDIELEGRFSGIQENRGKGCSRCNLKCVTLKGLWVFPNGKVSPCPQRSDRQIDPFRDQEYMNKAIRYHRRRKVDAKSK